MLLANNEALGRVFEKWNFEDNGSLFYPFVDN